MCVKCNRLRATKRQVLEPKAPPARNGPNTGSLAPRVRRRVNKKIYKKNCFALHTGFVFTY